MLKYFNKNTCTYQINLENKYSHLPTLQVSFEYDLMHPVLTEIIIKKFHFETNLNRKLLVLY